MPAHISSNSPNSVDFSACNQHANKFFTGFAMIGSDQQYGRIPRDTEERPNYHYLRNVPIKQCCPVLCLFNET